MAMPSDPGVSGVLARISRPAWVSCDGLAMHLAPQVSIINRRKGFWVKLIRTMNTLQSRPTSAQANARALPHCPAPVSVASRLMPNCLLYQACGTAVLGLWLPGGEKPSCL